jgi:hypothetical protein
MDMLWYQRDESLPAATPPKIVNTIQRTITGQRYRIVRRPSRASRPLIALLFV